MDIRDAYKVAKEGKYDKAIEICNEYISTYPNHREAYKQRSFILARMKLLEDAICDIDILINMGDEEPDDYFTRGRWNLMFGDISSSIADFTKVIEIEAALTTKYYTETAYFYRANGYIKSGLFQRAIEDCEKTRDGFKVYFMGKIVSKEDIVSEARTKLNPSQGTCSPL